MDVISRQDARAAGKKQYFTGFPCTNGHVDIRLVSSKNCRSCVNERNAKRRENPEYREELRLQAIEYRKRNPGLGAGRNWYKENPERAREIRNEWKRNNPEKVKECQRTSGRKYRQEHPEIFRLHARSRNKRVSRSTPPWVSRNDIRVVYDECPEGMEVDHFIPIAGRTVCGLHVPENLQYLTPAENQAKSNAWDVDTQNAEWARPTRFWRQNQL